jgi:hypothetical protein
MLTASVAISDFMVMGDSASHDVSRGEPPTPVYVAPFREENQRDPCSADQRDRQENRGEVALVAGSGNKVDRPAGQVGRPKGGGKRATEALSFVRVQPGITIPELAVEMGITATYLYRVLPGLQQEGKLEKKGRGWYPQG